MRRYLYWFLGGIFALLSILPLVLPNSGTFDDVRRGGVRTPGKIVDKTTETRRAGGMVPGLKNAQLTDYSLAYSYLDSEGKLVRSTQAVTQQQYESVRVGSTVTVAVARIGSSSTMSWLPEFRDMSKSGETGSGYHLFMWIVAVCFFFRAYIWGLKVRDATKAERPRVVEAAPSIGAPRAPAQRIATATNSAVQPRTGAPRGFGRPARG